MAFNENEDEPTVSVNIFAEDGTALNEAPILVPLSTDVNDLQGLCNQLLSKDDDDQLQIQFRTADGIEIVNTIKESVPADLINDEKVSRIFNINIFNFLGLVNRLSSSSVVSRSSRDEMHF